jgi:hypothetical protein
MVEVLESAWKLFLDDLKDVKDLDELIEVQHKFVNSILDKALLNEKNNDLSRNLQKILNQVYVFTYKKDRFFYPGALMEYDRQYPKGVATLYANSGLFGDPSLDQSMQQPQITIQSIE